MDTSRQPDGKMTLDLSGAEQKVLSVAVAMAIGHNRDLPPDPALQTVAIHLARLHPRPITFMNFCPEWAGPLSVALGDYAIRAQSVTNIVGPDATNPEFAAYRELGPQAEALAQEMAAIWGSGHTSTEA